MLNREAISAKLQALRAQLPPSDYHDAGILETHVRRFSFRLTKRRGIETQYPAMAFAGSKPPAEVAG